MEKRRRDLSVTLYRILLYLSRMRERENSTRRLMRIERAVSVDRKELRLHLERMTESGHVSMNYIEMRGRGGHPVIVYEITENGKTLRSDIGRWIDLGVRMGYYPEEFFYLPSDD
jgi:predicted ArsR family transcriptional regulator